MGHARSLAAALAVVVGAVAVFLVAHVGVRMYQLRRDDVQDGASLLVMGGGDPSGTDWRAFLMMYVGPNHLQCPFLIDTGFAGPTVLNPATLAMAPHNSLSEWVTAIESDFVDTGPPTEDIPTILQKAGVKFTGTTERWLSSLSGTHKVVSSRGTTQLAMTQGGKVVNRDVVVEYVPSTPSILTFTDMARMRVCVLDVADPDTVSIRIGERDPPPETAWPVQEHLMGVTVLQCRINGVRVRLVADTGFGGAVGLNATRRDAVVQGDACNTVLQATVRQVDVRANEVCAAVGMASLEIDYQDGGTVALGKVPVNINASDIQNVDGLIGLAVLRRLAPLVVDVRTIAHVPQLGTRAPTSLHDNWTPELIHAQFRSSGASCTAAPVKPCQ